MFFLLFCLSWFYHLLVNKDIIYLQMMVMMMMIFHVQCEQAYDWNVKQCEYEKQTPACTSTGLQSNRHAGVYMQEFAVCLSVCPWLCSDVRSTHWSVDDGENWWVHDSAQLDDCTIPRTRPLQSRGLRLSIKHVVTMVSSRCQPNLHRPRVTKYKHFSFSRCANFIILVKKLQCEVTRSCSRALKLGHFDKF